MGEPERAAEADASNVSALDPYDSSTEPFETRLGQRLRAAHDGFEPTLPLEEEEDRAPVVSLGPATQIELEGSEVRFLVPFAGPRPNEHWLQAFRRMQRVWPADLCEPRLDEGRGLQLGPLPVGGLDQHVEALKWSVDQANRIYTEEIEPELRRQREDAIRREEEERQLRSDVESRLRALLG